MQTLTNRQLAIATGGYVPQINDQTPADWNEVFAKLKQLSVACPDPLNE